MTEQNTEQTTEQNTEPETGGDDFAAALAVFDQEQPAPQTKAPEAGEKVRGQVVSIGEDSAFVDLGGKAEGRVHLDELRGEDGEVKVSVGDTLEAIVTGVDGDSDNLLLRVKAGRGTADYGELRHAQEQGIPVEGRVKAVNKGGVEVEVAGLRAFCPISQISDSFVEDANAFLGQRLSFRVTRFEEGTAGKRPDLVLSRRALLQEEAKAKAVEARGQLEVGATVRGRVTSLTSYGAFVDVGGVEGLLHVSEISHQRVEDPKEVLSMGQILDVVIQKIEEGQGGKDDRISLSRKALETDPWQEAVTRFPQGTVLEGKVVRIQPFGAFVELAPGLDGLVHVSEMDAEAHINHPRDVVTVGQKVEVKVLAVDADKRRISLSMAAVDIPEVSGGYSTESEEAASGSFGSMASLFEKALKGK